MIYYDYTLFKSFGVKMKILVMNWRDIKNPAYGGAEIVTHEHMKRWAKAGHECYLIASAFDGCKKIEG